MICVLFCFVFVLNGSSCTLAGGRRSVSFCSSWRDETLENPACVTESEGSILADLLVLLLVEFLFFVRG